MKPLYLETDWGRETIDPVLVEKYHLIAGTWSPFTHQRILDGKGNFQMDPGEAEDFDTELPEEDYPDDGIDLMQDGFQMSTSEILDFSQGVDSD